MPTPDDQFLRSSLNPRHLELTLMPTEECNFRCTYCYEDFSIGQMSPLIQSSLKRFIEQRIDGLRHLNLQWFGGEPLAAKKIIYDISGFAQKLCNNRGVQFSGAMTTNGYQLSLDVAEKLYALGQRSYQISLDGLGHVHDATRRLASGGGTFDRIYSNLQAIRNSDLQVSVMLRIHVTPDNIDSIKELASLIKDAFLVDPRFSFLLKPIENMGGPNRDSIKILTRDQRNQVLAEIRQILISDMTGKRLPSAPAPSKEICYASRPNAFVIRADGRVQKCTVALSDEHNTVGVLNEDGTILLDGERMKKWMRGYVTGEVSDLRCPAQNYPKGATQKIISIVQA